jgi:predicted TIM-barrel fold metal-dependent hydrolase
VLEEFLAGEFPLPDIWHPVFNLPYYHEIRTREFIDFVGTLAGLNITSLKGYEEAMFELFKRSKNLGVIAFKDQSAYRRVIAYDLPTRSDAEAIFNKLLIDPRNQLAWPDARPLDDYLFHQFMRFARELRLPVQLHTGHMALIRNRVDKSNAAHLATVLELHSEVQFDLFHGNWPYMGDILFLGKNYPNVNLDLCWVYLIDPLYAQELLKRAVMTVPHTKIFGFGGDYWIAPELSAAHLILAREVIAGALADLVESGWLQEEEAVRIAADWLFNNPNRFYNLGFPPYEV